MYGARENALWAGEYRELMRGSHASVDSTSGGSAQLTTPRKSMGGSDEIAMLEMGRREIFGSSRGASHYFARARHCERVSVLSLESKRYHIARIGRLASGAAEVEARGKGTARGRRFARRGFMSQLRSCGPRKDKAQSNISGQ